jgi:uncharacterized protein YdbL (DUF1318 family)
MRNFPARANWRQVLFSALWLIGASAWGAPADFEFNVQSASVMSIRKSLAERHLILKEHFQSGAIGFSHDGLIAVREPGSLTQDTRHRVELLVVEDNRDRDTLYREIARANGRPDWELQFKAVFAARWIDRAPVGWYHREADGRWLKKLSPSSK